MNPFRQAVLTGALLACNTQPIPVDPSDGLTLSYEGADLAASAGFQVFTGTGQLVKGGRVVSGTSATVSGLLDGPHIVEWERVLAPALGRLFTWGAPDNLISIQNGTGTARGEFSLVSGAIVVISNGLPPGSRAEWRVSGSMHNPSELLIGFAGDAVFDTLVDITPGVRAVLLLDFERDVGGTAEVWVPEASVLLVPVGQDSFPTVVQVTYQVQGAIREKP